MNLDWKDIHWKDPNGGTIVLHGVLPTVVFPNSMRPRLTWHGLGIMGSSEEIEVWAEEEKAEAKDPGIKPANILITIVENHDVDWSFQDGIAQFVV